MFIVKPVTAKLTVFVLFFFPLFLSDKSVSKMSEFVSKMLFNYIILPA